MIKSAFPILGPCIYLNHAWRTSAVGSVGRVRLGAARRDADGAEEAGAKLPHHGEGPQGVHAGVAGAHRQTEVCWRFASNYSLNVICHDAHVVCLDCRKEITVLEREQEEILKDLRLIESRSNQNKNEQNTDELGKLAELKSSFALYLIALKSPRTMT